MIKTKLFTGYFKGEYGTANRKFVDIDEEMNGFLDTYNVELIDIKYSVSVDSEGEMWNNALMIYKENIN